MKRYKVKFDVWSGGWGVMDVACGSIIDTYLDKQTALEAVRYYNKRVTIG